MVRASSIKSDGAADSTEGNFLPALLHILSIRAHNFDQIRFKMLSGPN